MNNKTDLEYLLNTIIRDKNTDLYELIIKIQELVNEIGDNTEYENSIKQIPVVRIDEIEFCPHCKEQILEKSMYYDGENWFHRPCIDKGRVIMPDVEYSDTFNFLFESKDIEVYEVNSIKNKNKIKTKIKPEDRTFKNLPKYSDGKPKVRFQDWLELDFIDGKSNVAKSPNGKYYGWSHRAVYGFDIGDKIKKGDVIYKGKEYTIKTKEQAKNAAIRFANEVS